MKKQRKMSKAISALVLSLIVAMSLLVLTACKETVTIKYFDGTVLHETQKIDKGEKLSYPVPPTKEGYVLKFWSTSSSEEVPFDQNTAVNKDLTLYAVWNEVFTVTYFDGTTIYRTVEEPNGEKLTVPTPPTKIGYNFKGWSTSETTENFVDSNTVVSGDMSLHAVWAKTVVVTLESEWHDSKEIEIEVGAIFSVPSALEKDGYNFKGWSTSATANVPYVAGAVTSDITLHAVWVKIYSVTIYNGNEKIDTIIVETGDFFGVPAALEKDGFNFKGWSTSETVNVPYVAGAVTSDITLHAVWAKTVIVTLESAWHDRQELVLEVGDSFIPNDLEKDGYNFKNWSTSAMANVPYDYETPLSGDITLYAVWAELFSVTFYNDGAIIQVDGNDTQTIEMGSAAVAPAQNPTKKGYTFKNWSVDFSNVQSDLSVNAVFEINSYVLTVEAVGKTVSTTEVDYDTVVANFSQPAPRTGVVFGGWFADKEFTNEIIFGEFRMPANSTTIYEKWTLEAGWSFKITANETQFVYGDLIVLNAVFDLDASIDYVIKWYRDGTLDSEVGKTFTLSGEDAGSHSYRAELYFTESDSAHQAIATYSVTIGKAILRESISGSASIYYGSTEPDFSAENINTYGEKWHFEVIGFVYNQTVSELTMAEDFSCAYDFNVPENRNSGFYQIVLRKYAEHQNYEITYAEATLEVVALKVEVSVGNVTVVYGDSPNTTSFTLKMAEGFVAPFGEVLSEQFSKTAELKTGYSETTPKIGVFEITGIKGVVATNYVATFKNENSNLIVEKKDLTITISGKKDYDGIGWSKTGTKEEQIIHTVNGIVSTEKIYVWENITGLANSDVVVGTVRTTLSDKGVYANEADFEWTENFNILQKGVRESGEASATGYVVSALENYNVTFVFEVEITERTLTVKANDATVSYNQDAPAFGKTITGFVGGDTEADLLGTLSFECVYKKGNNVGVYVITVSGLSSTNYNVIFQTGNLTVTKSEHETIPDVQIFTGSYDPSKTLANFVFENTNFTWIDATILPTAGNNTYKAKYNHDATNYLDKEIDVTVNLSKSQANILSLGVEHDFKADGVYDKYKVPVAINGETQWLTDTDIHVTIDTTGVNFAIGGTYPITIVGLSSDPNFIWASAEPLQTVLKIKTAYIGSDKKTLFTIEDALKKAEGGNIVVTTNTAFAPKSIADVWYNDAAYHTVKTGVTLLLPFDASFNTDITKYSKAAGHINTAGGFLTVSVPSDINLTVAGTLTVNAMRTAWRGSNPAIQGAINGANYATLDLAENSSINVIAGGKLNSIGFITGTGKVVAQSGSSVHDTMTLFGWRGGTHSLNIKDTLFPFNQYGIHNIETELTINYGANYYGNVTVASSFANGNADILLVSKDATAFLQLTSETSSIVKTFEQSTGKITFDVRGDMRVNPLKIKVEMLFFKIEVDTTNSEMPVPGNFNFVISSGTTTLDSRVKLLPGADMTVEKNATLKITEKGKLFVYNGDKGFVDGTGHPIGGYPFTGNVEGLTYAASTTYRVTPTFDYNGTMDAQLVVNGNLIVMAGGALAGNIQQGAGTIEIDPAAVLNFTIKELTEHYSSGELISDIEESCLALVNNVVSPLEAGFTYVWGSAGWEKKTIAEISKF